MSENLSTEEVCEYEKIIKKYLYAHKDEYLINNIDDINIDFKKLGGGMNKNYLIKITEKKTNIIKKYFSDVLEIQ
jgi:hypothetical protein